MEKKYMDALCACVALACGSAFGEGVIFREDFSGKSDGAWTSNTARFRYTETEGVKRSRALVWESDEKIDQWDVFGHSFPVEAGREYTYRAVARPVKDVVGRLYVRIACVMADGQKRAFTLNGRPIINNGWKGRKSPTAFSEIIGATPPLPAGAVTGVVEFAVMPPTTGCVVFDDLEITAGPKTVIRYAASGAYRDEATGGRVKFAAYYGYDAVVTPLSKRRACFAYRDRAGKTKRVAATTLEEDHFTAELDVDDFADGRHDVVAELSDAEGRQIDACPLAFTRAARLPVRKVRCDTHGRLIVDGHPFFPVGCYGCGSNETNSDLYASLGFNCALTGEPGALQRMKKRGIKVIFPCSGFDTNRIQLIVKTYGTNENVIAWYVLDELPPGFARKQAEANRHLHALDPDRPTFAVLDQPKTARDLLMSFDVIGTDPYPVSNGGRLEICSQYPDAVRAATFGMRPVWQVPQAFDWHWHRRSYNRPMANHRFPRPDEFANMTYQAVVAGATGIIWYDFDWFNKDIEPTEREGALNAFRETAGNLVRFADVFLSDEPRPQVSTAAAGVRVASWRKGGRRYVLVVNTLATPAADVRVVAGAPVGAVKVEFGRTPKEGPDLAYDLPPLGFSFVSFAEDLSTRGEHNG